MREDDIKKAYTKLTTSEEFDGRVKCKVESQTLHKSTNRKGFVAAAVLLLVVVLAGNATAYGVSEEYRNRLSEFLHINTDDTHYIGTASTDNGITMSVGSTHVVNNTAMILLVFTKENGDTFKNGLNPDEMELAIEGSVQDGYMCYTELSEDEKELNCYISLPIDEAYKGGELSLKINGLICNESQVTDLSFEEEFEEAHIKGVWKSEFVLREDLDNTVVLENPDKSDTVEMCGRTLQIENVVVGDVVVIANTITLGDIEPLPFDPFSSLYVGSGAYYGVFVTIYYENGEVNEMDCMLDDEGNIIAYSLEVIDKEKIESVKVGGCVVRKGE